jgi:hypothetical protein
MERSIAVSRIMIAIGILITLLPAIVAYAVGRKRPASRPFSGCLPRISGSSLD